MTNSSQQSSRQSGAAVRSFKHRSAGFGYVEVLVATVIISIALVPAIRALSPAVQGSDIHRSQALQQLHLSGLLEQVLAQPFVVLDEEAQTLADPTATSTEFSDTAIAADRRIVSLSRYDADNADSDNDPFTGVDPGLLWVQVALVDNGLAIASLVSQYD